MLARIVPERGVGFEVRFSDEMPWAQPRRAAIRAVASPTSVAADEKRNNANCAEDWPPASSTGFSTDLVLPIQSAMRCAPDLFARHIEAI
jgi:hypothetical protein